MAKYKKLLEPVFVSSAELINSMHGGEVYQIKFIGIETQKDYTTYADPNNQNWRTWEPIIDLSERKGVVISRGLTLKDESKGLINADSRAFPELAVSKEELANQLAAHWKSQDKFNDLFGPTDSDD